MVLVDSKPRHSCTLQLDEVREAALAHGVPLLTIADDPSPTRLDRLLRAGAIAGCAAFGRRGKLQGPDGLGCGGGVGLAYSALSYQLGDGLSDLDARGHATETSAWLSQPIVRSPTTNVSARLEVDNRHLDDDTGSTDVHDDRHTWDWTASTVLDHRDSWAGGGVTQAQLSLTSGQLGFDNANAQASDAATADTQGHELHWDGGVSRLRWALWL